MSMNRWETKRFGDCATLFSGGTPSKRISEYWSGDIPWVSSKDMKSERIHDTEDHVTEEGVRNGTRLVPAGTILIVVRSMILAKEFPVSTTSREVAFNQDLKAVVPTRGLERRFLFYWLLANREDIRGIVDEAAHGTKRIQTDRLLALRVAVPPLQTQAKIADVLEAYDDLIENNCRRIRILEKMARATYREWFVELRVPGVRVRSATSEEVRITGKKELPVDWTLQQIRELASVHRGKSYRFSELGEEGGLPFLNLKCIDRDGGFRRSGLKRFIGKATEEHFARRGAIVMAVTDMTQERRIVARAAMVPTLDTEYGVLSMDLVRIEPREEVPAAYLYCLFRFSSFADQVKNAANGVNVLHLAPARIEEYRVAAPPRPIMVRFAELVGPCFDLMDRLETQTEKLRETRDLLLQRLLCGEVSVEDLDIAGAEDIAQG